MNCDDCRQRLQMHLDGEECGADHVEAHLAHCPECRAMDGAARRLLAGLLSTPAPTPPGGLTERVVAAALADRRQRLRWRRRVAFVAGGLAVAASLLLTVLLTGSPGRSPKVVDLTGPGTSTRNQDEPSPPSLNDNMAEATSAVASLARKTADETVSNGQLLVPSVPLGMPAEEALAPPLDPPAQSLRQAGQGVATGLEPVATSARRAFDLFLRDMPPVTPEAKSGL
ncbi:MAG TPA: hypothetical protein VKA46_03050 [Gemmataceae bacterium]|nr:hypothetical protein [Gemmataceae bacterium]